MLFKNINLLAKRSSLLFSRNFSFSFPFKNYFHLLSNVKPPKKDKEPEKKNKEDFDFKKEIINFFKDKNLRFFGLEPNKFKLDPRFYFFAIIFTLFSLKQIYDWANPSNFITFIDFFTKYISNDLVKSIKIKKLTDGSFAKTFAEITLYSNEVKYVILGNVDHFMEVLERVQIEKGRSEEAFIPIEFSSAIDYKQIMDKFINVGRTMAMMGMVYMIFRSLKSFKGGNDIMGASKSNAQMFGIDSKINVMLKYYFIINTKIRLNFQTSLDYQKLN